MDKQQAASKYAIDEKLEEAGIEVIRDNESKYMHDKYMVIDRDLVMTGSYNYTNNAKRNRENMIVIYDSGIAKDFYDNFFEMYHKMKLD